MFAIKIMTTAINALLMFLMIYAMATVNGDSEDSGRGSLAITAAVFLVNSFLIWI